MPSEILTQLNVNSGMKLSIRRLSTAMDKLQFGESISKRIKGVGSRKVYSVLERSNTDELNLQNEYREEYKSSKPPKVRQGTLPIK
jgi:hypothetical protein